MHEIAFQADKRFSEWSVGADCSSSLFLFHEGILFVITFTRRIYSTSSHVFSPDSLMLPLPWREVGGWVCGRGGEGGRGRRAGL